MQTIFTAIKFIAASALAMKLVVGSASPLTTSPGKSGLLKSLERPGTCCTVSPTRHLTARREVPGVHILVTCEHLAKHKDTFDTFACAQGKVYHNRQGHFLSFETPTNGKSYTFVVTFHGSKDEVLTSQPIHCDDGKPGKLVHFGKEIFGELAGEVLHAHKMQVFYFDDSAERGKCYRVVPEESESA